MSALLLKHKPVSIIELLADTGRPQPHMALLWKLLGRKIQFHPKFITLTKSASASLMLSQAFYWTRTLRIEHPDLDGWVRKGIDGWRTETGLSRKEQDTARGLLRSAGFMEERKQGMPARLFFRLDLNRIADAIAPAREIDWNNDGAILELLGRPVVFHRRLVDVTGSVTAALMLSHSIAQTSRILSKRPDGWFWKSLEDWHREIGLSRWEMETARKKLRELGLLDEKRLFSQSQGQGNTCVIHYKINLEQLEKTVSSLEIPLKPSTGADTWERGKLDCGNPANSKVGKGQTAKWETDKQQSGKGTNSIVGNGQTCLPENLAPVCPFPTLLYKETENFTENIKQLRLQPSSQDSTSVSPTTESGRRHDALIYPKQLQSAVQEAIGQRLLANTTPEIAQQVLDVLAHAYQQPKGVGNPEGLVYTLLVRLGQGEFDPLPGIAVAARREQQRANEALLEQRRKAAPEFHGTAVDGHQALPAPREHTPETKAFLDRFLKKPQQPAPACHPAEPEPYGKDTAPHIVSGRLVLGLVQKSIIRKR